MEGYIIATNHVVEEYSVSWEGVYDIMCSTKEQNINYSIFLMCMYFCIEKIRRKYMEWLVVIIPGLWYYRPYEFLLCNSLFSKFCTMNISFYNQKKNFLNKELRNKQNLKS